MNKNEEDTDEEDGYDEEFEEGEADNTFRQELPYKDLSYPEKMAIIAGSIKTLTIYRILLNRGYLFNLSTITQSHCKFNKIMNMEGLFWRGALFWKEYGYLSLGCDKITKVNNANQELTMQINDSDRKQYHKLATLRRLIGFHGKSDRRSHMNCLFFTLPRVGSMSWNRY